MRTLQEYELTGIAPKCAVCGDSLDPETDVYHDSYEGSPHAHNGAGSYGIGPNHFIFYDLCENCRKNCQACDVKEEWEELPDEERILLVWEEECGTLCRTRDYWLLNKGNEHFHKVIKYYAWDNGSESRSDYLQLIGDMREFWGEDCEIPTYIPKHKQVISEKARTIYQKILDIGISINTLDATLKPHGCADIMKQK